MHKILIYILITFFLINIDKAYSDESLTKYYQAKIYSQKGDYKSAIKILESVVETSPSSHVYKFLIENLINDGQFDKAFKHVDDYVKKNPKDIEAIELAAYVMEFYKRDYNAAFEYYDQAYKLTNDNKYALSKALIAEKNKDFELGIDILNDLIKKEPENAVYYTYRGLFQYNLKRNKKAIKDLEKSINIKNDILAKIVLAEIYDKEKLYSKATVLLEDVIAENLEYEEIIAPNLAKIYIKEKKYKKATELYKNLANNYTGKKKIDYLKLLAQLFYDTNEYEKAAEIFKEIITEYPKDKESYMAAGKIYEYLKDYDNASSMYMGALKVDPLYTEVIKRLSVIYLLQDKPEEALKQLKYIDKVEQDVDYFLLSAEAYSLQKKYRAAINVLEEGLVENPTNTIMLSFIGSMYFEVQDKKKALVAIEKAYKIEPNNPIHLNFLGYLYAEMDMKLNEAKELIEKALKNDPENAAYLDSLGWVYFKLKNYNKAYIYLKKAYNKEPKNDEIKGHFLLVKEKLKK